MNSQEQAAAAELLDQIKNRARQEPEKAKILAETYAVLISAAKERESMKP